MNQERVRATRNLEKLNHYGAAVSLYVAHYNLCRVHESLRTTPAIALGVAGSGLGDGNLCGRSATRWLRLG
ncbi:hypothetical protein [Bradyrhizobium sp. BR 1433]|uniref:hypothetical protein n=1 Tax=Bradyrhizobium sp. BR 1433 TaxID=3447967 RepID=UPI003EE47642